MNQNQKDIVYGGAFNPPTIGHYEISKFLLKKFPNSNLMIMPTNSYYNKEGLVPFQNRFEMVDLMAQKLNLEYDNRVKVSDLEYKDEKFKGTYYTLEYLNHPYFVIGADSLATLSNWINGKKLIEENYFIVFPRVGYNIELILKQEDYKPYQDHFIILDDFDNVNVSSTLYRENKNEDLLLEEVSNYIKINHLYE